MKTIPALAALTCVLGIGGFVAPAHATIIGANSNINFSNSSVTFGFGDALFTLTNNPDATYPLSVSTSGSAQVLLFPGPIPNVPHVPGGVGAGVSLPSFVNILGQEVSYEYGMFPDATPSPSFNFFGPFLGLKFMLDDGIHYGFAKILNTDTLVSYAYESEPGVGIVTGPVPTAVPEPSSLSMLGFGLGLLGLLAWMRRRATPKSCQLV